MNETNIVEKCRLLFESISCLCCEGPEFMTKMELMKAIGKDAGKGYDLCKNHHNMAVAHDMLKKCLFYTKCRYKDLPDCTVTKCRHYEPACT